jgi:hypothetical protein
MNGGGPAVRHHNVTGSTDNAREVLEFALSNAEIALDARPSVVV